MCRRSEERQTFKRHLAEAVAALVANRLKIAVRADGTVVQFDHAVDGLDGAAATFRVQVTEVYYR